MIKHETFCLHCPNLFSLPASQIQKKRKQLQKEGECVCTNKHTGRDNNFMCVCVYVECHNSSGWRDSTDISSIFPLKHSLSFSQVWQIRNTHVAVNQSRARERLRRGDKSQMYVFVINEQRNSGERNSSRGNHKPLGNGKV